MSGTGESNKQLPSEFLANNSMDEYTADVLRDAVINLYLNVKVRSAQEVLLSRLNLKLALKLR
jgi:hypothetical protein